MTTNGRPWRNSVINEEQIQRLEMLQANAMSLRQDAFRQLFDPRRNIDDECGYPSSSGPIPVELYRQLYDREAIANRVVQVMPKECWQQSPMVYEDEDSDKPTEFEEAWDNLEVNKSGSTWHREEQGSTIWEYLQRIDVLSGIGHFGVLLLGIDDGLDLQEPVEGFVQYGNPVKPANGKTPAGNPTSGGKNGTTPTGSGTRTTTKNYRPVRNVQRTTPMPDGPMTENERKTLEEMVTNKSINLRTVRYDKEGYSESTESRPVEFLNHYDPQVARNVRVQNQQRMRDSQRDTTSSPNRMFPDGTPSTNKDTLPLTSDPVNNDAWGERSTKGTTSKGELFGTDQQYAWQGAMPPQSLSGTDAQYFGVQFGPSEQPADKPAKAGRKLLFIRCFDESLVQVVRWEWNVRNPRFGQPVMYRITLNDPKDQHSGVGLPLATVFVHWSRVVHINDTGSTANSSEVMSVPRMQPVVNRLLDLRKLYAGSAEGYWKAGCMPVISFETNPQLGADPEIDVVGLRDMVEQVFNTTQRFWHLAGMQAKVVAPTISDPTPQIANQIEAICICLGIPVRVFKGSERGELASSQDDASWNDRVKHRQAIYVTPRIVAPFIDHLIGLGVLPEPEGYHIEWPDLDSNTDKDKAAIALQIAQALAQFVGGNLETVMAFKDFLVRILKWDEEEAQSVIDTALEMHEKQETMSIPPQIGGRPAAPEPGTEDHADAKQKADQFKQMTDMKTQQIGAVAAKGVGGKPGVPPVGTPKPAAKSTPSFGGKP